MIWKTLCIMLQIKYSIRISMVTFWRLPRIQAIGLSAINFYFFLLTFLRCCLHISSSFLKNEMNLQVKHSQKLFSCFRILKWSFLLYKKKKNIKWNLKRHEIENLQVIKKVMGTQFYTSLRAFYHKVLFLLPFFFFLVGDLLQTEVRWMIEIEGIIERIYLKNARKNFIK